MTQFEYLGVFISVIVGLAVAHIIRIIGVVILNRKKVQLYWPHSIWCLNMLFYLINFWWFIFFWSRLEEWHYLIFILLISYAILLSLVTLILLPGKIDAGFNFKEHFYNTRRWFFALSTVFWCIDMAETYLKHIKGVREMPRFYIPFLVTILILTIAGIITDNKIFHRFFPIFWFLWVALFWSTLVLIIQ